MSLFIFEQAGEILDLVGKRCVDTYYNDNGIIINIAYNIHYEYNFLKSVRTLYKITHFYIKKENEDKVIMRAASNISFKIA